MGLLDSAGPSVGEWGGVPVAAPAAKPAAAAPPAAKPPAPAAPKAAEPAPKPEEPKPLPAPTGGSGVQGALADIAQLEKYRTSVPPPKPHLPEKPKTPIDDIKTWGAIAIAFAAFASLRTRTPMTTALNAASSAMQAMAEGAKERVDTAFKEWERETRVAMEMANYEQRAYEDWLNQITNREELKLKGAQMLDSQQWREQEMKFKTLTTALQDPVMQAAYDKGMAEGGPAAAIEKAAEVQKLREDQIQKNKDADRDVRAAKVQYDMKMITGQAIAEVQNTPAYQTAKAAGDTSGMNRMIMERIRALHGKEDYSAELDAIRNSPPYQEAFASGNSLEAARLLALSGDPKAQKQWEDLDAKWRAETGRGTRFAAGEEGKDWRLDVAEGGKDRRLDTTEEGKDRRLDTTEGGKDKRLEVTEAGKAAREERLIAAREALLGKQFDNAKRLKYPGMEESLKLLEADEKYVQAVKSGDNLTVMKMRLEALSKYDPSSGRTLARTKLPEEDVVHLGDDVLAGRSPYPTTHDIWTTAAARQIAEYVNAHKADFKNHTGAEFDINQSRLMPKVRAQLAGKDGDNIRYFTVLTHHLDFFQSLSAALRKAGVSDTNSQLANTITAAVAKQFGMPEVPSFEFAKQIVGDEMTKAILGSGAGGMQDRDEMKKELSAANTPEQMDKIIASGKALSKGQLEGQISKYREFMKYGWLTRDEIVPADTLQKLGVRSIKDPSVLLPEDGDPSPEKTGFSGAAAAPSGYTGGTPHMLNGRQIWPVEQGGKKFWAYEDGSPVK